MIDGRENIVTEVDRAPLELRRYLIEAIRILGSTPAFNEALAGQIPPDQASQQRLPKLREKLRSIAGLR